MFGIKKYLNYRKKVRSHYENKYNDLIKQVRVSVTQEKTFFKLYDPFTANDELWHICHSILKLHTLNEQRLTDIEDLKKQLELAEKQLANNGQYHVHIKKGE